MFGYDSGSAWQVNEFNIFDMHKHNKSQTILHLSLQDSLAAYESGL